ncbi:MAG TPA: DUF72 domain-containing protein [Patescibacteria group bacterium]|nr:DUF72 domain-containing protein [Patescibacteria group bacterium]
MTVDIRTGLCGFSMALNDYVTEFPLVEVQQTFYEPPRESTMRRWRAVAPDAFEFIVKAWQLVTHEATSPTYRRLRRSLTTSERADVGGFRTSPIALEGWARSVEAASILRASAILVQCPPSFRPTEPNVDRLRAFMTTVDRPVGIRILWEPRGGWPPELVRSLCVELGLVHVVDPFVDRSVTPEATYYRLHGITGPRHVYDDDELRRLLAMIPRETAGTADVLFNNIGRIDDARRFVDLAAASRTGS